MGLLTRNGVLQSLEQFDYVEDWMELRHGGWELEAVCILADSSCHYEGSEQWASFCKGCVVQISLMSKYTLSPM